MSKYGGVNSPTTSIKLLAKGCYGLYKAAHPETEDEYEEEKGDESKLDEYLREVGYVGSELVKSFYDIVVKGK